LQTLVSESLGKKNLEKTLLFRQFFFLSFEEEMSGQSIFESEADPRIKWALDLMSEDGIESTSVIGHFAYPAVSTGLMYFARSARNYQLRRPLSTGLPLTVALLAASWFAGSFFITQIAINQHLNSFSNLKFHYFKLNVKIKKEAF
jgi:hypothetical protein